MWKSEVPVSHRLPHHEPSLYQSTLSERLVPVGVPVPAWEGPSEPTSPGAADAEPGTSNTLSASSTAAINAGTSRLREDRSSLKIDRLPGRVAGSSRRRMSVRPPVIVGWLMEIELPRAAATASWTGVNGSNLLS